MITFVFRADMAVVVFDELFQLTGQNHDRYIHKRDMPKERYRTSTQNIQMLKKNIYE